MNATTKTAEAPESGVFKLAKHTGAVAEVERLDGGTFEDLDDGLRTALRKARLASAILDEELKVDGDMPNWERVDRALALLIPVRVAVDYARAMIRPLARRDRRRRRARAADREQTG